MLGLVISCVLLATGLVKRSYESEDRRQRIEDRRQRAEDRRKRAEDRRQRTEDRRQRAGDRSEQKFNHRLESCREVLFLLPIIICSVAACWIIRERSWWIGFSQHPVVAGLLGSMWGYFVGCGVVWGIRIFGTLAFGREAMGLGDVHLMGAAGAVIGPLFVVVAFFVAPFFGLAWAGFQMFFKKIRQIPYGPFLSLGILVVMILHDQIRDYLSFMFWR
jgi:leader peptidase (prepilin peptidase)/N-methyltransferase